MKKQQLLYYRICGNHITLRANKTSLASSTNKFLGDTYIAIGKLPDPMKVELTPQANHRPGTPRDVRHITALLIWNIEFLPNDMILFSHLTDY